MITVEGYSISSTVPAALASTLSNPAGTSLLSSSRYLLIGSIAGPGSSVGAGVGVSVAAGTDVWLSEPPGVAVAVCCVPVVACGAAALAAGCGATVSFPLTVTLTFPNFLVFLLYFSFTVTVTFPSFFALITPFFVTAAFVLDEETKLYDAFLFLFLITMLFFSPTFIVTFFVLSVAFFAACAFPLEEPVHTSPTVRSTHTTDLNVFFNILLSSL